jgi:hypothetical protein
MPGVSISTAVRTGPVTTGVAPASTFFLVGETERGMDSAAVRIASLAEYITAFGGYESGKYTYQQARTFFEEGGSVAYVARASASDGVASSLALLALPSAAAGITLTAVGRGAWGDNLYAAVSNDTTTFGLTVYYGGSTSPYEIFSGAGYATLTDAIDAVENSSALANYCTAALTSGASPTALLASASATAFADGDNGAIASTDFTDALELFGEEYGAGAVAIPGLADGTGDDTAVWQPIINHCAANNRIALLSFASGTSDTSAASQSTSFGSADNVNHEYAAFFYPWVKIPSGFGVALTIPPEAYVAAIRSKAQNSVGTWKPYAGSFSEGGFVNGTATALSTTKGNVLDDARVNAIRVINNTVRIYGARSHSTNTAQWRFITHRETVNYVVDRCNQALEPLVFSTIDGRRGIFGNITSAIQGVMEPIRIAGGLFEGFDANGKQLDYGYTVKVDDSINPLSQLESGLIKAQVGLRVSTVGDKITVTVTKSNLTATLV